ncbi:MAG: DUF1569 domain-containing protein [Ginsengibacter sp.]
MWINLFDTKQIQVIIDRIDKLKPDTRALWGKMTVGQMLAHSQKPLMVALGKHQIKRGLMALLFGKMVKKQYTSTEPLKHNQPTSKSFIINGDVNFAEERDKLKQNLIAFSELGQAGKLPAAHPFFGKLTPDEWNTLQYKHLDHHLLQFGV